MLKIKSFLIRPMIGFGYWKDNYIKDQHGIQGYAYNVIFLCFHYQVAFLEKLEPVSQVNLGGSNTQVNNF